MTREQYSKKRALVIAIKDKFDEHNEVYYHTLTQEE